MEKIVDLAMALLGGILPLFGSAMIPNGSQRWGAAIFGIIGLFIFFNLMGNAAPSHFAFGLAIGFMLATAKLTTGYRFL